MTTRVHYNGHPPDQPLTALFDLLDREPIDPTFAPVARDSETDAGHRVYFGGFFAVTHVFYLVTDDAALIAQLDDALVRNGRTEAYRDAMRDREAQAAEKLAQYRRMAERPAGTTLTETGD